MIADVDAMAEQIASIIGATRRRGLSAVRRLRAARSTTLERSDFIDRNLDCPLDLLPPSLARLVATGWLPAARRRRSASFFTDERLRRIFTFQSMYAGRSPYDALAIYAVIAYMDCVAGVWFPVGGMHAVPAALAAAATKHGVEIRYDTK